MKNSIIYKKYKWLDRANARGMYSGQSLGKYTIQKVVDGNYFKVYFDGSYGEYTYFNKDEIKLLFENIDGTPIEDTFLDSL